MTILAQDTFAGRTVGAGTSWGTASDGNTWFRTSANDFTVLSVGSGEGKTHSGTTNNFMLLGSGTATDQEGLVRMSMGQTGDSTGLILRSSSDGSTCYYAEIGDFTNDITIYKFVSGTRTLLDLQAAGFTVSNGSFYWMRFQVKGTTLKTRLWADGSSEPGTWQSNFTDSSIASGQYGIFLNCAGSTDAQFDHYQANDTATSTVVLRDATGRLRLASLLLRDLSSRLILGSVRLRDIGSRVKLAALPMRDVAIRFNLFTTTFQVRRDVSLRLVMVRNPNEGIILTPLPTPVGFMGIGVGPKVGQPADTIGGPRQ